VADGGHGQRYARGRGVWGGPAGKRTAGVGDAQTAAVREDPHCENDVGGGARSAGTEGERSLGSSAPLPPGTPPDRAQRNFTDPDSRIMKARDGFIQGYNAQTAVDATHQVFVA